jgi:hypothetical protein
VFIKILLLSLSLTNAAPSQLVVASLNQAMETGNSSILALGVNKELIGEAWTSKFGISVRACYVERGVSFVYQDNPFAHPNMAVNLLVSLNKPPCKLVRPLPSNRVLSYIGAIVRKQETEKLAELATIWKGRKESLTGENTTGDCYWKGKDFDHKNRAVAFCVKSESDVKSVEVVIFEEPL